MQIDFDTYDKPIRFCDLDPGDPFIMYTGDFNEHELFIKVDDTMTDRRPNYNCVCLHDGLPFVAKDDDLVKYREGRFVFNN